MALRARLRRSGPIVRRAAGRLAVVALAVQLLMPALSLAAAGEALFHAALCAPDRARTDTPAPATSDHAGHCLLCTVCAGTAATPDGAAASTPVPDRAADKHRPTSGIVIVTAAGEGRLPPSRAPPVLA